MCIFCTLNKKIIIMKALKIISFFIALIGLSVMFALLILFLPLYYAISLIAIVAIIVMLLLYVMIKENEQDNNREEKVWHLIEDNPYDLPREGKEVIIYVNCYIFNAVYENGEWLKIDGYPVGTNKKGDKIYSSYCEIKSIPIAWMEIPD